MAATEGGLILGTPAYMSPEHARGGSVDKRTDIWAFGCVLYEMLTKRKAFGGATASDTIAAVLKSEPDWKRLPRNLHFRIGLLLERCLEREARDRYHDIADARVDIEKVLADPVGVQAQPEVVGPGSQTRIPWIAAVLGIVITGVVVWNLRPAAPVPVTRFSHVLPEEQRFTGIPFNVLAVSPDGSRLAYVANQQLYLKALDALESNPIPGTDENPANPFFSPDGEWIGYWSASDNQLKKVAVSGGAPVTISDAENPYGAPSWGPDDFVVWSEPGGIMMGFGRWRNSPNFW